MVGFNFECIALPAELYPHMLLGTGIIIANMFAKVNPFLKKVSDFFVFVIFVSGVANNNGFLYNRGEILYSTRLMQKAGDTIWIIVLFLPEVAERCCDLCGLSYTCTVGVD